MLQLGAREDSVSGDSNSRYSRLGEDETDFGRADGDVSPARGGGGGQGALVFGQTEDSERLLKNLSLERVFRSTRGGKSTPSLQVG